MVNNSLSLGFSTDWQTNIGIALNQARSEATHIITRTNSDRKQREEKCKIMMIATLIATVALGILTKMASSFFVIPAIGFGILNIILRARSLKEISFTEQEDRHRSIVWTKVELLSDLLLWSKGRASPNDDSEHRNFSQQVTPRFNRFLDYMSGKPGATMEDPRSIPEGVAAIHSNPNITLSLSELTNFYSIFRDIAMYRYLQNQGSSEREVANIFAKSIGCSQEQILERFPPIPKLKGADIYDRIAYQCLVVKRIDDRFISLAGMFRRVPIILPVFSTAGRM